jgi:hypothetical protein
LRVRHGRSREDDAGKHQVSTKPHESIPLDVASLSSRRHGVNYTVSLIEFDVRWQRAGH